MFDLLTIAIVAAILFLLAVTVAVVSLSLAVRDLWRGNCSLWLTVVEQRDAYRGLEAAATRRLTQANDQLRALVRRTWDLEANRKPRPAEEKHPAANVADDAPESDADLADCPCAACQVRRLLQGSLGRPESEGA